MREGRGSEMGKVEISGRLGAEGGSVSRQRVPTEGSSCAAEDGHNELAVGATGAECWLCGGRGCDCEVLHPPLLGEQCTTGPVTPEQRTIGMAQVTPDKADGMRQTEELRFSIGPAAVDAAGDESEEKRMPNDLGQLGPAIVEDKTSAEQDEIRELKALMDELQTSAGAV